MKDKIRWGIMGTGSIAAKFAQGLVEANNAVLVGVGSRSPDSAKAFADKFTIPNIHGTQQGLANDSDIDVIYVASPHPFHKENTLSALNAGKHVLCEKPFAMNADETRAMIACAKENNRFLMEAMWTRFFPLMSELRARLSAGAIGEPRMLTADFGFRTEFNPERRAFNPDLGGGALLDVGVYPVSLSSMIFGTPSRISGMAHLGATGVDEQSAFILGHAEGQLAILHTAVRTSTTQEATILGTEGQIRVRSPWWSPDEMTVALAGQEPETVNHPYRGNGFTHEAEAVSADILAGRTENALMPLSETVTIMETLDSIRAQWGLKYPME